MRSRTNVVTRVAAAFAVATALAGAAGCAPTASPSSPSAPVTPAAVPPTPSGWSLVWTDDFTGAGQHPAVEQPTGSSTRAPATRAARPNWGTGEIQTYTNQHPQPLAATAAATCASPRSATARAPGPRRRIETQRSRLQATGRRGAAHRGPHPDAERHRRRGRSGTGRRSGRSARPTAATTRTGRAIGEFDVMENVNGINSRVGRAALRRRPGRAVQRVQRPRRQPGLPGRELPERVPHLPVRVGRSVSPQRSCAGTSTGSSTTRVTQSQVGEPHWTNMTSTPATSSC